MGIVDMYHLYFHELADPRTSQWPLMDNPLLVLLMTGSYLYFILVCGPKFMKNRPAYDLLSFTKSYNVFQIVANSWFIYDAYRAGWFDNYGFICRITDYDTDPLSMRIASLMYWLLVLKLVDYVETCVFILRKKDKQITFLHLYHHVSTVMICWLVSKYYSLGVTMFISISNCGVHVIMYSYYYLSTLGPAVQQKIAPFKKMVTIIQLIQFVIQLVYCLQAYLPYCNVSLRIAFMLQLDLVINLILFSKFYVRAYVKPKKI